jgi:hypothetical protein
MGTESPKRNAFALGFSLPIASFFRVARTKTLFGWRFGPPLAMALALYSPSYTYVFTTFITNVPIACMISHRKYILLLQRASFNDVD